MTDATLRDVARASGCSVATVSRVLAGTRPVGAETAERVRAAAEQLGYRPNHAARALRSRATGTVGLVLPQITNPFYPTLVRELTHALHADGRAVLLADCDDDPEAEAERIADLLARRVDALLVIPAHERRSREAVAAAAERVPLVLMDRGCGTGVADSVAVDNATGMALVLDHLAAAGRRRVCFIGAAGTASAAAERRLAYESGAAALDPGAPDRVLLGDFSVEWGRAAVDELWESGPRDGEPGPEGEPGRRAPSGGGLPDALVCANDLIAIGALQRLQQRGVDVPGQVAVTGFDDIPMAALSAPGITTVRQPVSELAAEAARLLSRPPKDGTRPHRTIRLAPDLVVRESSAARQQSGHSARNEQDMTARPEETQ
ncbi:LacI family DNA-binding transcriptional regulator [Streptomyces sp. LHD-70]|uniref:LacI family DNA-binding transcriptional regulator n=1 Tax=Streptomyces sp. LHD-70 TaxID=3072140 RepID=UPI00280C4002|nr:LacI family DNA-binding transcriptional regulator [Streptomyces sp. LHD-70]MDQ8703574.1 LacI family DNA-binding transcriptional regulator [Streptomyces sp. LHD-70]